MQKKNTDAELETLRKENIRLKAELSEQSLRPSMKHWQQLQEELQFKDELLSFMYESMRVYLWIYDMEKHKLSGLSRPRQIWTSDFPKDQESMENFLARVPENERKIIKDYILSPEKYPELKCKFSFHGDDGITHYYNCKGRSIWNDSGDKVVRAIGLIQEITEQQQIEKELLQKELLLNNAYKLTNISSWYYDFTKDEFIPSEQLRKIWTPPAENATQAFLERLHPEDRKGLLEAIKHPKKASAYDYSWRITGDDGNMYYMLSRCTIECDKSGKPLMAHGITWDITEKRLHEKQSLQTETHLRFFFERIGLGAWEYNVESQEIFMAESILEQTAIKHQSGIIKREDFLEKVHFLDQERVESSFDKVLSRESLVYDCSFRLQVKNNKYLWVLLRGVPVFDNRAQTYKVLGCIEDLSESRRYNVIKERLSFMQHIADALPIPVYYKDMKGCYVGYNDAFEKFIAETGTANGSLVGKTALELHNLRNVNIGEKIAADEKDFVANPNKSFEKTYVLKDASAGGKRVIVNKKRILYDSDNTPRYLVGGLLDVTDLKLAEERLRQTTERLNTTLDAMSEMVMCFNKNLTLQWANRAARIALGGENKRFNGRKWDDIWKNVKNLDSETSPVHKILNNSEEFSSCRMRTSDGRIFRVRAYPVYSSDEKVSGVVEMSMDITENEAIRAKAEIHKEQLILADKMKSLRVLISGVAHEINNPNNFISINSALLEKMWGDFRPFIHENIKKYPDFKVGNIPVAKLESNLDDLLFGIRDGSERIGKIISSLKGYIRNVPSGISETFNLNDALENAIFLLKNQIVRATNNFTVKQYHENLPVRGIQQKIEQVIINVLQNACQALQFKDQCIQIRSYMEPDRHLAMIKIKDTGIGMEPHILNYITDPFFTTRREDGGTGLGLSISSSILEEHKGRFKFTSKPGRGTSVEIILPVAEEPGNS